LQQITEVCKIAKKAFDRFIWTTEVVLFLSFCSGKEAGTFIAVAALITDAHWRKLLT
jgi:hypothetical protein